MDEQNKDINQETVSNNIEQNPVTVSPTQTTQPVTDTKEEISEVEEINKDEVSSSEKKTGLSEEDLVDDKKNEEVTDKKLRKLPYILFILILIGIPLCVVEKKYLNGDFNKKTKQEVKEEKKETINKYGGLHKNKEDEVIPGKTLKCSYEGNVSDINDPLEYDMFKGMEDYFDYKSDYTFLLADESNEIERVRVVYNYYYKGPYIDMNEKENDVISDEQLVEENAEVVEVEQVDKNLEDLFKKNMKKVSSLCGSKVIDYPFYNCKIEQSDDYSNIKVTYKISNDTLVDKKTIIANNLTFNSKMEFDMLSRAFSVNGPNNKQYVCIEE